MLRVERKMLRSEKNLRSFLGLLQVRRRERTTKRMKGGLRYPEPHVSGALDVERKEEDAQIRIFLKPILGLSQVRIRWGNKDQKEGTNKINFL